MQVTYICATFFSCALYEDEMIACMLEIYRLQSVIWVIMTVLRLYFIEYVHFFDLTYCDM